MFTEDALIWKKIQKNANALILIHAWLVHNGNGSKYKNNQSYNQSHDLILCYYLVKDQYRHDSEDISSSTLTRRSSSRQEVDSFYQNHTQVGKVDRNIFCMCGHNYNKCVSISGTKEFTLEEMYHEKTYV